METNRHISWHRLWPALGAAAVGLLGCLVLFVVLRPEAGEGFEALRQQLRRFDTVTAQLAVGSRVPGRVVDPGYDLWVRRDRRAALRVRGEEAHRQVWDGRRLSLVRGEVVVPAPRSAGQVREVWDEVRAGFPNSTWTEDPPQVVEAGLPRVGLRWASVDLPFDWAEQLDLLVALSSRGIPRHLVVVQPEGTTVITVVHLTWDARLPSTMLELPGPVGGSYRAPPP